MNRADFDRRYDKTDRRHDIMTRVVVTIIALVFVAVFSVSIFAGFVAAKAVNQVGDQGVRGVVESLWCGKTADCKLPL